MSGRDVSPWQPAATIPQDGTHVLAYFPRHPLVEDDDGDEAMNGAVDLGGVMAVTWKSGNGWIGCECARRRCRAITRWRWPDADHA